MYYESIIEIFEEVSENNCRRMCPMFYRSDYLRSAHWCSYRNLDCDYLGRQSSCPYYLI